MTELIVALDGLNPIDLMLRLHDIGVRWFKAGHKTAASGVWDLVIQPLKEMRIFIDLKMPDTEDTVSEAVRRYAEMGIAAVSTFTNKATLAAQLGAKGSDLRVWRVVHLTDNLTDTARRLMLKHGALILGDGVICPVPYLSQFRQTPIGERVCAGIRFPGQDVHGHKLASTPGTAKAEGATHIVVGRPIWQADDPVAAARKFLEAIA